RSCCIRQPLAKPRQPTDRFGIDLGSPQNPVRRGEKMPPIIRKVQLAFASAILTLLIAGGMSYRAISLSNESDRWVRHTHEVLKNLHFLFSIMGSIDSRTRG